MPRYSWTLQNSPKPSHRRTPCDYISAVLRMIGTNNMFLLCYLFRPDSVLRGPNCWSIKPNSPDFRCTSSCLASGGLKNPSNGSERSRVALFARLLSSRCVNIFQISATFRKTLENPSTPLPIGSFHRDLVYHWLSLCCQTWLHAHRQNHASLPLVWANLQPKITVK
jgi:hypothetical protein